MSNEQEDRGEQYYNDANYWKVDSKMDEDLLNEL